jgi:hypothetical protein
MWSHRLVIYGDSNLVVQQTMKLCDAVNKNKIAYRDMYNLLEGGLDACKLNHILRSSNMEADALANIGSTCAPIPSGVALEQINERSTKVKIPTKTLSTTEHSGSTPSSDPEILPDANEPEESPVEGLLIEPAWTQPFLTYIVC